jgi:hypothetical protein
MWKEATVTYYKVLSLHMSEGTEEYYRKVTVRIIGVLIEIRTGHLPNTSRNYCRLKPLSRHWV